MSSWINPNFDPVRSSMAKEIPLQTVLTMKEALVANVNLDSKLTMALIAWILMNVLKIFATLIPSNNQLNVSISKADGNANVLQVSLHPLIRIGIQS